MTPRHLSLTEKIDLGLVKGLNYLLIILKNSALWLIGLLALIATPVLAVEYDEGLADISWNEAGTLIFLALLLYRHIRYCRRFSTGFWAGLSRPLMFLGALNCLWLALTGAALALLLDSQYLNEFLSQLRNGDPFGEMISDATLLLAIFLAAPTAAKVPQAKTDQRSEPDIFGKQQP